MRVNNPPKMYVVLLALVCLTLLLITRSIPGEAGMGLIGLIVGYGVGNGIAAKNNEPVDPIFGERRRDPDDSSDT